MAHRRYSIRLRNGEHEVEIHHDAEFIAEMWYKVFPRFRNVFLTESSEHGPTSVGSGTEDGVRALPDATREVTDDQTSELAGSAIASTASTPKSSRRRKAARITQLDKEQTKRIIEAPVEGLEVYHEAMTRVKGVDIKALLVLHLADERFGIKGLSAQQITQILTDRFRQAVSRQGIQGALDKTKDGVLKQQSKYVIMQPGIARVERVLSGEADQEARPTESE